MPINKLKTTSIETDAITADLLAAGSVTVADIPDAEITDAKLHTNLDFSTKTFTMHNNHITQAMVTQHQAQLAIGADQIDSGSPTFGGDVVVTGNLTVNGTTTTLNTETLTVDDNIIVLNNNEAGTPSQNAGIEVERGTSTNVSLRWNETTDNWQFTNDGTTYNNLGTSDIVNDTTPQLGGDLDTNGNNISFGDSATPGTDDTLSFGEHSDLQIYHNSSDGHNYMQIHGKRLYIKASDSGVTGPQLIFDHDTATPSTLDFSTVLAATSRDSAGASQTIGQMTFGTPNVTSGSFRGSLRFDITDSNGIVEYVRLDGNNDRIDLKKAVRFSEAFTFPTSDGSANQVLQTDGAGVVTWASAGGEITVQDEGSDLSTAATTLNFVGAGVTATGTGATKTISISGTGGGATSAYAKFTYEITTTQSSVSGSDVKGDTLSYNVGNNVVEVFVNGVKQQEGSGRDYQATTGNSVVFTDSLYNGDIVDVIAYNMFDSANINVDGSGNVTVGNDLVIGNQITTASNGNVVIDPNGSGHIQLKSNIITGSGTSPASSDDGNIYIPGGSTLGYTTHSGNIVWNANFDSGWKYIGNNVAQLLSGNNDGLAIYTAGTGLPGASVTWSEKFRVDTDGNVGIATNDPQFKLHVNKGSSNYAPNNGIDENIVGFQTSFNADGPQILTFSQLDGNWIDGTSGDDSAFGWVWGYANSVRGGLVYDHRGSERMQMFSSYGALAFITPDSADGDGVPIDSNMNERLTILPGGNVGIGSTNPGAPLQVNGTAIVGDTDFGSYNSTHGNLMVSNGANETSILLYNDAGAYNSALVNYNNNVLKLGLNNANSANTLLTTTAINVTSTGVGIGTDAPGYLLDVYKTDTPTIRLNDGGQYQAYMSLAGNDLEIRGSGGRTEIYNGSNDGMSSTKVMVIENNQRVGIGTELTNNSVTNNKLHVLDATGVWQDEINASAAVLRLETNSGTRGANKFGSGIVFNGLGGHSTAHGNNIHAWIGLKYYDTPGHERTWLVFGTNNTYSGEAQHDAGCEPRLMIDPMGRHAISTDPTGYDMGSPQNTLNVDGGARAATGPTSTGGGIRITNSYVENNQYASGNALPKHAITIPIDEPTVQGNAGWANIGWANCARSGEVMHRNTGYIASGRSTQLGFYIEAGRGEAGGICLDEDSFQCYGSSDSGTTFRIIDKDSDVVIMEMLQSSWNMNVRGNVNSNQSSFSGISDQRLKKSFQDVTTPDILTKYSNLDIKSYIRIDSYDYIKNKYEDVEELREVGLVAQEVEAIFPEAVGSTPVIDPRGLQSVWDEIGEELTEIKNIDQTQLLWKTMEAVQELIKENTALKERVQALESA